MAKSNNYSPGRIIVGLLLLLVIAYVAYGLIEKCWTPWKPSSCEGFTSQQSEVSAKNKAKQQEHFKILKQTVQKNRDEKNQIMENFKQLYNSNAKMKRDILSSRNMNDKLKENFTSRIKHVKNSNIEKFTQLRQKLNNVRRKEKFVNQSAVRNIISTSLNGSWVSNWTSITSVPPRIKSVVTAANATANPVDKSDINFDTLSNQLSQILIWYNQMLSTVDSDQQDEFNETFKGLIETTANALSLIQMNIAGSGRGAIDEVDSELDKLSSDLQKELTSIGGIRPGIFGRAGASPVVPLPPGPHPYVGQPWTLPSDLSDKDWCKTFADSNPIQPDLIKENAMAACMYIKRPCRTSNDTEIYDMCRSLGVDNDPAAGCEHDAERKNINCGVNSYGVNTSEKTRLRVKITEFIAKLAELDNYWKTGSGTATAYRLELKSLLWLFTGGTPCAVGSIDDGVAPGACKYQNPANEIPPYLASLWEAYNSNYIRRIRNPAGWNNKSVGDFKEPPIQDPTAVRALTAAIDARLARIDDSTPDDAAVDSFMNVRRRKEKFGRRDKMKKLAFLHSNHCGHCKNVMPDWDNFRKKHERNPDVEIITIESAGLSNWSGPQPQYFPVWFFTLDGGKTWQEAKNVPRHEGGWESLPVFAQQYGHGADL